MSRISTEPYFHSMNGPLRNSVSFLNQVNRPSESDFRAFQNLVNEHSIEGVPASLYNQTKSVPDPWLPKDLGFYIEILNINLCEF